MLEYCNGGNLEEVLDAKSRSISAETAQKIMWQLVSGLHDMM